MAMTVQEQLAALQAENERLREAAKGKVRPLSLKIGEKGGVVLSGLQRFPVTLGPVQWRRVFAYQGEIEKFIEANKSRLVYKGEE